MAQHDRGDQHRRPALCRRQLLRLQNAPVRCGHSSGTRFLGSAPGPWPRSPAPWQRNRGNLGSSEKFSSSHGNNVALEDKTPTMRRMSRWARWREETCGFLRQKGWGARRAFCKGRLPRSGSGGSRWASSNGRCLLVFTCRGSRSPLATVPLALGVFPSSRGGAVFCGPARGVVLAARTRAPAQRLWRLLFPGPVQ